MKRRSAFTFVEVLFAVMILGIGMIMVAAMFPAALKQTQANVEDGASGSIARLGDSMMQQLANNKDIVSPAVVPAVDMLDRLLYTDATSDTSTAATPFIYSFHDPRLTPPPANTSASELWQLISPNLVSPSDPQYAWVPLFSRSKIPSSITTNNPGPHPRLDRAFRLYVIPVRCRNRSSGYVGTIPNITTGSPTQATYYAASDVYIDSANDPANLDPALIQANVIVPSAAVAAQGYQPYIQIAAVYYGSGAAQTAAYSDAGGSAPNLLDSNPQFNPVATGAYVVVSNAGNSSIYNGAVFKIGTQVQSDGTGVGTTGEYWSIAPDPNGYSLSTLATALGAGGKLAVNYALVVGRGPDVSSAGYTMWATTPTQTPMPRAGVAQDLGIFMTVIALP